MRNVGRQFFGDSLLCMVGNLFFEKSPDSKVLLRKLKALLRKESRFAAFKRDYIRENSAEYMILLLYVG